MRLTKNRMVCIKCKRTDPRILSQHHSLASAPFLATRCLHQLAIKNQDRYPEASRVIHNDFYVDDLSGGNDISTLRWCEVTDILQSAGFHLHKWNINEPTIFDGSFEVQKLPRSNEIKTLGICWNITDDCLQYRTCAIEKNQCNETYDIINYCLNL